MTICDSQSCTGSSHLANRSNWDNSPFFYWYRTIMPFDFHSPIKAFVYPVAPRWRRIGEISSFFVFLFFWPLYLSWNGMVLAWTAVNRQRGKFPLSLPFCNRHGCVRRCCGSHWRLPPAVVALTCCENNVSTILSRDNDVFPRSVSTFCYRLTAAQMNGVQFVIWPMLDSLQKKNKSTGWKYCLQIILIVWVVTVIVFLTHIIYL